MPNRSLEWVLRIAVGGEFLGHGALALQGKAQWVGWIEGILSVDTGTAATLLFWIGALDVAVGAAVLLWRKVPRLVLAWAVIWGFWTAILRPIVGESIWDFIERFANWGAPLALLLVYGWPKKSSDWLKS